MGLREKGPFEHDEEFEARLQEHILSRGNVSLGNVAEVNVEPTTDNFFGLLMYALNPKNLARASVKRDLAVMEATTGNEVFGDSAESISELDFTFSKFSNPDVALHTQDSVINKGAAGLFELGIRFNESITDFDLGDADAMGDVVLDQMREMTLPDGFQINPELSSGTDAVAMVVDPLAVLGKLKLFGKIIGQGIRKVGDNVVIARTGKIRNPENVELNEEESLAAQIFSDLGFDLTVLKPVGQKGMEGVKTPDFLLIISVPSMSFHQHN